MEQKSRKTRRLSKELGLLDVFAICTGAMISSGFFLLPGIAAAKVGPAVILAYALSGVLILPALFSMAELSTAMPRAGGTYFFISRSLGAMFGTIDGIGDWLAMLLKCSVAFVGLGAYLSVYLNLPVKAIAALFCVVFMVVNLVGAKEASGLQIGMVGLLLVILGFFIVKGLPAVSVANLRPFAPFGGAAILPTTGFVFVSYIGLTKVASVSEEVRDPERNIPLGRSAVYCLKQSSRLLHGRDCQQCDPDLARVRAHAWVDHYHVDRVDRLLGVRVDPLVRLERHALARTRGPGVRESRFAQVSVRVERGVKARGVSPFQEPRPDVLPVHDGHGHGRRVVVVNDVFAD